jgi:hypothetical protein
MSPPRNPCASSKSGQRLPAWAAALALALTASAGGTALAQRKPPEPARKEDPAAEPKIEIEGKGAILQGLDKVTARVSLFEADIGKMIAFGSLQITVRRCQRSRPDQKLERAAFLEIDDIDPATKQKKRVFSGWFFNVQGYLYEKRNKRKRVFSGWMFSSNPALSALEHGVYDVWVKDCK